MKFVNSGEILLEFTLGEHVNIADLFGAGQSLSKLVVSCLSIGSAGYFWHELPATSAEYFEKVEDLANPNMKVDIRGGFNLQRHWLGSDETPKLIVLEEGHLQHAAICAVAFGTMPEAEAEPIFGAYLSGLTMLGKSDAHLSLDQHAFAAFQNSLQNALKHFGDWDGEAASLLSTLHELLSGPIPNREHRDGVLRYLSEPAKTLQELQEYTISAKRVADLYLVMVGHRKVGGTKTRGTAA